MTIRNQRFSILKQPIFSTLNQHLIDYPTPSNLSYWWGFGPLAGICLVIQIVTGVFLAMHYTPHVDLVFNSVEHIMMNELQEAVAPFLHASGYGGMGEFNPPPAPSDDNSFFVCTDEPARGQEVGEGEVSRGATRKREWQAAFHNDEAKEMRLADQHMTRCEKRIEEIVAKALKLYENGQLYINISEEADIERGIKSYFADIYNFPSKESRRNHLREVLKAIGNERSGIWNRIKGLIEN